MLRSLRQRSGLCDAESACYIAPMSTPKRDYSETLFLPQTDFPMRAGLPQREPEILKRWEEADLYKQLRAAVQRPRKIHPA